MTKAEKFNLYADTLYGMCRKAQDTVPEANVCFECKAFSSEKSGTYRAICIGITTAEGSRKYYDVCEALRDMETSLLKIETRYLLGRTLTMEYREYELRKGTNFNA